MNVSQFTKYFVLSIILIIVFGFVVPSLVSAHDDIAVSAGIGACVIAIYIASVCGIRMFKKYQSTTGDKK